MHRGGSMRKLSALALAGIMALVLASCAGTGSAGKNAVPAVSYKSNYYKYINEAYLADKKIPSDSPWWGPFYLLREKSSTSLGSLLNAAVKNRKSLKEGSDDQKIADLYLCALDSAGRNKAGLGNLQPYFDAIKNASDIPAYIDALEKLQSSFGSGILFTFGEAGDELDSSRQEAIINSAYTGMSKGDIEDPGREDMHVAYRKLIAGLLAAAGESQSEAQKDAEDIFNFNKELAGPGLTAVEQRDFDKYHNIFTPEQLKGLMKNVDLLDLAVQSGMGGQDHYIVYEPAAMRKIDSVLVPANLALLKKYAEAALLDSYASYLTMDMRNLKLDYQNSIRGIAARKTDERIASDLAQSLLPDEFGKLYAANFFNPAAKKDVESIVNDIKAQYAKRIDALDWMSAPTKAAAKKKLAKMALKIGYPDKWPDYHNSLEIKGPSEGGVLIDNVLTINAVDYQHSLDVLSKPTDKTEWITTPQTVNAFYNPNYNDINFPAAILQQPFYDAHRSRAENLGAIGAVIGHEISHGFDDTGAQYDENGNHNIWWAKEDYEKFMAKAQQVKDLYSGFVVMDGIHINGDLTAGENIADLGGVAVSSSLVGDDPAELRKYYESYGRIWAELMKPEYAKMLIANDTHSPNEARVNLVVRNTDTFYIAYPDLKEGDPMYMAPEARIKIW